MKQISSSEFRRKYATLNEPTQVLAFDSPIGTWVPKGTSMPAEEAAPAEPNPRMTIRPDKSGGRKFVGTSKRVLDPNDMREQARERQTEITPRQFITKRAD